MARDIYILIPGPSQVHTSRAAWPVQTCNHYPVRTLDTNKTSLLGLYTTHNVDNNYDSDQSQLVHVYL